MSNRGAAWMCFSNAVMDHIEDYTVPQYGDYPDDQLTTFSIDDCANNMRRYINRIGRNARGTVEALRDMKKVAHYANVVHDMILQGEEFDIG